MGRSAEKRASSALIACFLFGTVVPVFSQRYLTDVFAGVDSSVNIAYGIAPDVLGNPQTLLLDFYEPRNDSSNRKPLILYLHGGGFISGSRKFPTVRMICESMARKGYAVASVDYRLAPAFDLYNSNTDRRAMTDAMHDAKAAVRFFRANALTYRVDTSRIIIGGESAGAITAVMTAYVNRQLEMSVYPMANPNNPVGTSGNPGQSDAVMATLCLCGMILDTAALESATNSPLLFVHGSDDNFIPLSLAYPIVIRAINVGIPVQGHLFTGATHCPWYYTLPNWQAYLDSVTVMMAEFLYPRVTTVSRIAIERKSVRAHPNEIGMGKWTEWFNVLGRKIQGVFNRP